MQHFNYKLVENNITLYGLPSDDIWKHFLLESSIPEYNILGETMIIPEFNQFEKVIKHDVIGAGTHAFMGGVLSSDYLDMGRWHQSKEKVSGHNPYAGYLTNKKWHLNEVKVKDD